MKNKSVFNISRDFGLIAIEGNFLNNYNEDKNILESCSYFNIRDCCVSEINESYVILEPFTEFWFIEYKKENKIIERIDNFTNNLF